MTCLPVNDHDEQTEFKAIIVYDDSLLISIKFPHKYIKTCTIIHIIQIQINNNYMYYRQ